MGVSRGVVHVDVQYGWTRSQTTEAKRETLFLLYHTRHTRPTHAFITAFQSNTLFDGYQAQLHSKIPLFLTVNLTSHSPVKVHREVLQS